MRSTHCLVTRRPARRSVKWARNAAMQRSTHVDEVAYAKDVFFACRKVTHHTITKCYEFCIATELVLA